MEASSSMGRVVATVVIATVVILPSLQLCLLVGNRVRGDFSWSFQRSLKIQLQWLLSAHAGYTYSCRPVVCVGIHFGPQSIHKSVDWLVWIHRLPQSIRADPLSTPIPRYYTSNHSHCLQVNWKKIKFVQISNFYLKKIKFVKIRWMIFFHDRTFVQLFFLMITSTFIII